MSIINIRIATLMTCLVVSCSDTSKQDYQNYLNSHPRAISGELLEDYINKYLAEKVILPKNENKAFCAHEYLRSDNISRNNQEKADFDFYFWVLCEEYNKEKKIVATIESPVSIKFSKIDDQFKALSHRIPRDGTFYQKDFEVIFPSAIRNSEANKRIFSRKDLYYRHVKKNLVNDIKERLEKS